MALREIMRVATDKMSMMAAGSNGAGEEEEEAASDWPPMAEDDVAESHDGGADNGQTDVKDGIAVKEEQDQRSDDAIAGKLDDDDEPAVKKMKKEL